MRKICEGNGHARSVIIYAVEGKKIIKKARAARRRAASPINQMETDSTPSSKLNAGVSAPTPDKATNQVNSGAESKSISGTKPTDPPKGKNPPPFYLLKGSNFDTALVCVSTTPKR
ncbi:hypothetical protein EVAR_19346_1 [Eumeta japonica]|uniref:Uncharacterized protein n=1 Tax=Eumeta variegata TaxID=151549 RepID=A0A4C1TRN3_EUMVA|nr:hypothetical protein EVAR_19346_1 [Eumeta japonica]